MSWAAPLPRPLEGNLMNRHSIKAKKMMTEVIEILESGTGEDYKVRVEQALLTLGLEPDFIIEICAEAVSASKGTERTALQFSEMMGSLDVDEIARISLITKYYIASLAFVAGYKMAKDEAKP